MVVEVHSGRPGLELGYFGFSSESNKSKDGHERNLSEVVIAIAKRTAS